MSDEDNNTSTQSGDNDASSENNGSSSSSSAAFTQDDVDRIVAERLSRERDKAAKKYGDYDSLKEKASRLEQLEAESMSAQEKAVKAAAADTEARVRTEEQGKAAKRIARAELKAAAAGRVEEKALKGFLEYADLAKFIGDDGEPNAKAIEAVVKDLAGPQSTDFDGGARSTAQTNDMNDVIRRAAGIT
jgi:hypothetical protein